jgi:hypothetical protein
MWILPYASVVIQMVRRDGRPFRAPEGGQVDRARQGRGAREFALRDHVC